MAEKMNTLVKQKWVAALRSGDYQQTTDELKNTNGYCCLGVLCDIYAEAENNGKWDSSLGEEDAELPAGKVVLWAELPGANPEVRIEGVTAGLSMHNDGTVSDGKRRTFLELADAIEAQL